MTTPYEIPFEAQAQTFVIALAGVNYRFSTAYNTASACWMLDIATPDGAPIATGIPIVTGVDLLGQLGYLKFGGQLFVQSSGDPSATPGYADLGVNGFVFFVVP